MRLRRWMERAHAPAVELDNILARVRAGVWPAGPPPPRQPTPSGCPTFHEYASGWLQAKIDGVLGERPIDANTESDYRWRLANHLLPFFGEYRLDEIDAESASLQGAQAPRSRRAAARHRRRRRRCATGAGDASGRSAPAPSGSSSTRSQRSSTRPSKTGTCARNPARSRRMRIRVPKPSRTFLEMDELVALIDAAGEQDPLPASELAGRAAPGTTAGQVAAPALTGHAPQPHRLRARARQGHRHLPPGPPAAPAARRLPAAARSSPPSAAAASASASSATCASATSASTTPTARASGSPTPRPRRDPRGPDEPRARSRSSSPLRPTAPRRPADQPRRLCLPQHRGGRIAANASRDRRRGRRCASTRLAARGLPPLPNTTPHTLRRTYISIALLANRFDVLWVMRQVGHADSKMTPRRLRPAAAARRSASTDGRFDTLVRQAREQLYGDHQRARKGTPEPV